MIKAIETVYNGYRFRSRLEARWAVFFDVMGIKYEYEKEGYDLGNVWYLPDFWLPQVNMWAEVKATEFNENELVKAHKLAEGSGYPVLKLIGIPDYHSYWAIEADCYNDEDMPGAMDYALVDQYLHDEHRFFCSCWDYYENKEDFDPRYIAAVESARQARFEHGETPNLETRQ